MYCISFKDSALPYVEIEGKVIQVRAGWAESIPNEPVFAGRFLELDLVAVRPRDPERGIAKAQVRMVINSDSVVSISRTIPQAH